MGYEVIFRAADDAETTGGLYLGSSSDLTILRGWVESLPSKTSPRLKRFFRDGVTDDAYQVAIEADDALDGNETKPSDPMVVAVVNVLIDILDRWPERTQAMLSDGSNDQEWPEPPPAPID